LPTTEHKFRVIGDARGAGALKMIEVTEDAKNPPVRRGGNALYGLTSEREGVSKKRGGKYNEPAERTSHLRALGWGTKGLIFCYYLTVQIGDTGQLNLSSEHTEGKES